MSKTGMPWAAMKPEALAAIDINDCPPLPESWEPVEIDANDKMDEKSPLPQADVAAFDRWWAKEGRGMISYENEDHVRRMCAIAWLNGAYKASEA